MSKHRRKSDKKVSFSVGEDRYDVIFHTIRDSRSLPAECQGINLMRVQRAIQCVVVPLNNDDGKDCVGYSYCSWLDKFNFHVGRYRAFARAIEKYSRKGRTLMWEEFRKAYEAKIQTDRKG